MNPFDPTIAMAGFRDSSMTWMQFMGIPSGETDEFSSLASYAQAPADEAWVYSCIRKLYSSAQGVPLRVYVRAGKDIIPATDEPGADGDDLQRLLDYVNPVDMTGSDLKAYTVASYATWGECYWRKLRGRYGGPPQELYWLRAMDIDIRSDDGRTPRTYVHQPTKGPSETYLPRDVVPFKFVNLANPLRGLSPLSAVRSEIATGRMWAQKTSSNIRNDSIPPGYWMIPREAEFTKQDEGLVRRTLRSLRERRNRGRAPIMPTGIEWKTIALSARDAEMVTTRKLSRMAVCAAFGVPLVLAGDDEKTSVYANLRDAERVFWRMTMVPLLDGYADVLNNWLLPDFDPSRRRLMIAFDYSEIEALKPTLDVEWNMWLAGIYSQAVVPNEFRRHFRLGGDVPWGDRPIPRTAIAIRPDPASISGGDLPGLMPGEVADLPDSADVVVDQNTEVPEALRAFGKRLYQQPAVKAWVLNPDRPLDVRALFGRTLGETVRSSIEDGLRRRASANQIAEALREGASA